MKTKERKQAHLDRIYNLMVKKKTENLKEDNYLTKFFELSEVNYSFPSQRAYKYKKHNFVNPKIEAKLDLLEKCFN